MNTASATHPDLLVAEELFYKPYNLLLSNLTFETESQEYAACTFTLNNKRIAFRVAKITPTKNGQFVTLWKRINGGETQPYESVDPFDFYIISTRSGDNFGQFIFPREILLKNGVLANEGRGGKRGFRLYPPWDMPESAQARKTQSWQLPYFCDSAKCNIQRVKFFAT